MSERRGSNLLEVHPQNVDQRDMPVLLCTTIGLEKAVFFFFSVTLFIVYFKSPGPWCFGCKKEKYSINFCDSYIFEKVRTVQFFDV